MVYHLRSIWLIILLLCCFSFIAKGLAQDAPHTLELSHTEIRWLQNHPVLRVANETDWPPFDFNESGQAKGLGIEYFELLAGKIGIEIEFVFGYSWVELVDLFKKKEIDVMPVFYKNKARSEFTLYTNSYYKGKLGVFTNDRSAVQSYSLIGKRVGMEAAHGSRPLVKDSVSGVKITEVTYKTDLVRQLATNKLDAIIGNPFVFYYIARENQISNIRLTDYLPLTQEEQNNTSLHIGVRKDWPILHGILVKAMATVTEEEMAAIENKWANIEIVEPTAWRSILYVLAVVIVVVIFLLWNNKRLNQMVAAQTQELQNMNEELELQVLKRTKKLTDINEELNASLEEVRKLRGILPICAHCKKIRDDKGYWNQIEAYIQQHSEAEFSHSICQDCASELYPDIQLYDK